VLAGGWIAPKTDETLSDELEILTFSTRATRVASIGGAVRRGISFPRPGLVG